MTFVIKRNSTKKEKFSLRKLEHAIEMACREAKLGKNKAKAVAREIALGIQKAIRRKSGIKAVRLRSMALRRLGSRSRAAVTAWKRYDRKRRR